MKARTKHQEALAKNPNLVDEMRNEIASKQAELRTFLDAEGANVSEDFAMQLRAACEEMASASQAPQATEAAAPAERR